MRKILLIVAAFFLASHVQSQTQHIVKSGETLSIIAAKYKTTVAALMQANNIGGKGIILIGQKLVIPIAGTVVNNASVPKVAASKNQHIVAAGETLGKIAKQYNCTDKQLKEWNNLKTDLIKVGQVLVVAGSIGAPKTAPAKPEVKPKEKVIELATPPLVKEEPITKKVVEEVPQPKPTTAQIKVEQPVVTPKKIDVEPTPANITLTTNSFFEKEYGNSGKTLAGKAKVFKTAAGWQDKKYYILTNLIEPGTVVKLTANNKIAFAKVLGVLPDAQNTDSLALRISSATAVQLGITDISLTEITMDY